MGEAVIASMPWPIFTIDFDASSLDDGTYPIEVGVCRWDFPAKPIKGWSMLIKPISAWKDHGSWCQSSQSIHGIKPDDLINGDTPTNVVSVLNDILGTNTAFCDGGEHDLHWAWMLSRASGVRPKWDIQGFDQLADKLDQLGYMRMLRWLERAPPRHRARDDAERLMKALARGMAVEHGTSVDISIEYP